MSFRVRREVLARVAARYGEASRGQKGIILDEFVATSGYDRKYAIRLLSQPVRLPAPIQRPRERRYGPAVQEALGIAWTAANEICAKRLVPFLPELVPTLERHGHLVLDDTVREQLLSVSAATADRLLKPLRKGEQPHGIGTTKPGWLLKKHVPVRTFAEWTDAQPGFMEADLVAHCGGNVEGSFLHTLCLTDVATGWTECLPLLHRTQAAVAQGIDHIRQLLPMPLLGLDTDNGNEFLSPELLAYCEREHITFTRGRVAKKNDQCFIEQKNGSTVRQIVGYDRFSGLRAYRQLGQLYRAVRLYVNFFQPSLKLRTKQRVGSQVHRTYHPAQTPFQRLVATDVLSSGDRERLDAIYHALDPVRLLHQVQALQDALWRHAVLAPPAPTRDAHAEVRFDLQACGLGCEPVLAASTIEQLGGRTKRKYRRTKKSMAPRWWRSRKDPFETVWTEVRGWLEAEPERNARSLFAQLQAKYPEQYPPGQLRTFQRRVSAWRAQAILTFDEQSLADDALAGRSLPRPLRVAREPEVSPVTDAECSA
jgi:hypothetical protein